MHTYIFGEREREMKREREIKRERERERQREGERGTGRAGYTGCARKMVLGFVVQVISESQCVIETFGHGVEASAGAKG